MNKKLLPVLFAAVACMAFCPYAPAQSYTPAPVTISKEKVKLNGILYYAHTVLERQTLYSIAKTYGVTEQAIIDINPVLKEKGLQKDSIIYIPISAAAVQETAAAREAAQETAARQDTVAAVKKDIPEPVGYITHTVRWLESLDDIARKYGVPAEDIMAFNHLATKKVSRKQVLRIPTGKVPEDEEDNAAGESVPADDGKDHEDVIAAFTPKNSVDMALLLPFNAKSNASVSTMDFYAGVLLAVKDLKESGIGVRLSAYDMAAGMPDRSIFTSNDFVIGPTSAADLASVLSSAAGEGQIVSPLDQKALELAGANANFVQIPSPSEYQYRDMARWVKEDFKGGDKVVLIAEKNGPHEIQECIANTLSELYLPFNHLYYSIPEGTTIAARLGAILDKDGENRIILASENSRFVGDVMRNLGIMLGRNYRITIYAPSKVRSMDSIGEADMHKADMHVSTAYFADYSSPEVRKFVLQYRALYGTEPSQFAFQGYDTAKCLARLCTEYGKSWKEMADGKGFELLHTDVLFARQNSGALVNTAVRRIIYRRDFTTGLAR